MHTTADLKYTQPHEWVRAEADGTLTIGVTDHAQEALGDIVFVQFPEAGRTVTAGTNARWSNRSKRPKRPWTSMRRWRAESSGPIRMPPKQQSRSMPTPIPPGCSRSNPATQKTSTPFSTPTATPNSSANIDLRHAGHDFARPACVSQYKAHGTNGRSISSLRVTPSVIARHNARNAVNPGVWNFWRCHTNWK